MRIFNELPPTAGWPIHTRDLLCALVSSGNLEDDFKQYLNAGYAKVTASGTAGLYFILEAVKNIRTQKKVVIPAYICPLVPLAIKRAGLEVEVCDISEESFNFDLEELERICAKGDIGAIIAAHLAGVPLDLEPVKAIAAKRNMLLIEDCAQSLGARYKNRPVGTLGDVAFFSLARGKGLTIYEGGVAVTNDATLARLIEKEIKEKEKADFSEEALKIIELLGYWMFYRRGGFWLIFGLPQALWKLKGEELKAYSEDFQLNFPVQRVGRFRKAVGKESFHRLQEMLKKQREKADCYIRELSGVTGINIIKEPEFGSANYPYLVLIFEDPARRDKTLNALQNAGLGASLIYLKAVGDYPYLKDIVPQKNFPNAYLMAKRTLTLSTSVFIRQRQISQIAKIIREI